MHPYPLFSPLAVKVILKPSPNKKNEKRYPRYVPDSIVYISDSYIDWLPLPFFEKSFSDCKWGISETDTLLTEVT